MNDIWWNQTFIRDIDTSFTLDGFHNEGTDLLVVLLKAFLQRIGIVVRNAKEPRDKRAEIGDLWCIREKRREEKKKNPSSTLD